ncbi:hypothetical protein BJF83_21425 [Nocardiopsis sp. CNR-923]|uniref:hypothetical protein n=1 Tax=Nocardiopsis sp. CNR-923 TaxID=1904965 RepID=UPI000962F026|nr:hypothetical protein [Nocardiopsis sp. CNR-923]OLT26364.1 hypothetical protein BJF83_21425 [Nocardiopsis sp. CNR-923]
MPTDEIPGTGRRYVLPHTEISLSTPVMVSDYGELALSSGIAVTTRLNIDGVDVGVIENGGTGGPTLLRTINSHRPAWRA